MIFGTTYSHRHAQYLKLDPDKSLAELLDFGFDSIRLACYWEEIEKETGKYDYSAIRYLLDACEKRKQNVILSVGMKAPRWPEYFFPKWLETKTPDAAKTPVCAFIKDAVRALQSYTCITHWQVENEPLDPSGKYSFVISADLLEQEALIVRELDSRPIVINLWGNELIKRNLLHKAENIADVIGLDIYYKVPLLGPFYKGPDESDADFHEVIKDLSKPVFITELQAEPWENNLIVSRIKNPKSMNETILRKNITRALLLKPAAMYFWGFEYWLWQKERGDLSLWNVAKNFIREEKR